MPAVVAMYGAVLMVLSFVGGLISSPSASAAYSTVRTNFPEKISIKLQSIPDEKGKINYLMESSWKYRVSNPSLALTILQYTLAITSKENNDYIMSNIYNYSGVVNYHLMNYIEAVDCFKHAIRSAESSKNYLQLAYAYNNLALVYGETERFRSAIRMGRKSLQIMRKLGNKYGEVSPLFQLSMLYANILQYDSAFYYAGKIYDIAKKKNSKSAYIRYNRCMGTVYLCMAEYEHRREEDYFNNGLYFFFAIYDSLARSYGVDNDIAKLYALQGNASKAVEYALRGISIGKLLDSPKHIRTAMMLICDNIEKSDKKDSIDYYLRYIYNLQDSLANISLHSQIFAFNNVSQLKINDMTNKNILQRYSRRQKLSILLGVSLVMIMSFVLYQRKQRQQLIINNKLIEKEIVAKTQLTGKLQEAINVKDKFISIVAHDLRNPINSYQKLTTTLQTEYNNFTDEDRKELLGIMKQSAENIHSLLNNLLQWSNAQQRKIKLNPREFDIKKTVDSVIKLFEVQTRNKNLTLQNDLTSSCIVYADEDLITIVVRNLISNAIKFTNSGGKICFGMHNLNFLEDRFYVRDNGVGMPAEKAANLFDVSKAKSEIGTSGEKGTGLGLAISYELVKMHGGDITVESAPGEGTCFYFSIKTKRNAQTTKE